MSIDSEQAVNEWFDNNRDKYPEISSYEYLFKKLASVIYHSRDKEIAELKQDLGDYMQAANIEANEVDRLQKVIAQLQAEMDLLLSKSIHYHVNNGVDDTCNQCGFDLRNPIHFFGL